jgi:hypothetical protein
LIETESEKVGQVGGLSVLQLGDFGFGRPARITAQVRLGKGEVVDIEREVELGGPTRSRAFSMCARHGWKFRCYWYGSSYDIEQRQITKRLTGRRGGSSNG